MHTQIDGKVQSYYQSDIPYLEYTNVPNNEEYNKIVGDFWYNNNATIRKTYIYTKTPNGSNFDYKWSQQEIPKDIFDFIDGKRTIYTSKPTNYSQNDIWILENDTVHAPHKQGEMLVAEYDNASYLSSDWIAKVRYTDNTELNNFLTDTYVNDKASIQTQIDGKVETWFQTTDPNIWSVEDRAYHNGDMWFKSDTKELFRYNASTNAWDKIQDQKAIDAYDKAEDAQDTADGKRRVFVATPTTPYDIGDLWTQGTSGDLMRCKVARATGNYDATDWEKAVKYTDDTTALSMTPHHIILSNENQSIITDINGVTKSDIIISTSVDSYKGSNRIAGTIGTLVLKDVNGNTLTGATLSKTNPTATTGGTVIMSIATGVTLLSDVGYIEIPITIESNTYTKKLTWNKVRDGKDGSTASAKVADIIPSTQIFKSSDGGTTYTPDNIALTPILQNVTFSKWQYSVDGGTTWTDASGANGISITSNVLTLSKTSTLFTTAITSISFKLITSDANIYDVVTIVKLNDVSNISIGGRNYALSTLSSQSVTFTGNGSANQCTNLYRVDYSAIAGKQVTLGFDVVSSVNSGTFTMQWNATPWGSLNTQYITASTTKQRIVRTSTQPVDGSPTAIQLRLDNLSGTITISNFKLELGNQATDWSPAPEDLKEELDTFIYDTYADDLSNQNAKIDAKADTFYQPTMPHIEATNVTSADSYQYTPWIGDLWYNSTPTINKTYMYTKTANGSNFDFKWSEQKIPTEVFDKIDGKKSIYLSKPTSYSAGDLWILEDDTVHSPNKQGEILTAINTNTQYGATDWTAKVRYADDISNLATRVTSAELRITNESITSIVREDSKYLSTARTGLPTTIALGGVFTGSFDLNMSSTGTSDVGEIRVNAGSFTLPNGGTYTITGDKELSTNLEGSVTGTRYIMFIATDITRFTFPTTTNGTRDFIEAEYSSTDSKWYYYANSATKTAFTPNDKDCIVAKITKTSTSGGIDKIEMYASKVATYSSLVSMINQTAETIKIQASKIDLSGYATFSSLSTNDGTTIINGSNITTGTINANKVNVTNINASNITSGTIDADYIDVININASNISVGTLYGMTLSGATITGGDFNVNATLKFSAPTDPNQFFSSGAWMKFYKDATNTVDLYYSNSLGFTINDHVTLFGLQAINDINLNSGSNGYGYINVDEIITTSLNVNGVAFTTGNTFIAKFG